MQHPFCARWLKLRRPYAVPFAHVGLGDGGVGTLTANLEPLQVKQFCYKKTPCTLR